MSAWHDYQLTEHFIYLHKQTKKYFLLLPFGLTKNKQMHFFFISQREVRFWGKNVKMIITKIFSKRKNEEKKL